MSTTTLEHAPTTTEQEPIEELLVEEEQEPQIVAPASRKHRQFWKSPWFWTILILPLLCGGGVSLALHPEIITNNINQPYALLFGPALGVSGLAVWLVIKFFQGIVAGCTQAWSSFHDWRRNDSGSFFWIVITVFLLVSVTESGAFFNKLLDNFAFGLFGYFLAFAVDMISIQFIRARLAAVRSYDVSGKLLSLLGVISCAGLSAYANLYTALEHFGVLPPWMTASAPWIAILFPSLIILMSLTADHTQEQTSTKLDPLAYRAQEEQRIKIQETRRDMLKRRLDIEAEIRALRTRSEHISWWGRFSGRRAIRAIQQACATQLEEVETRAKEQLEQFQATQRQISARWEQERQQLTIQAQNWYSAHEQLKNTQEGMVGALRDEQAQAFREQKENYESQIQNIAAERTRMVQRIQDLEQKIQALQTQPARAPQQQQRAMPAAPAVKRKKEESGEMSAIRIADCSAAQITPRDGGGWIADRCLFIPQYGAYQAEQHTWYTTKVAASIWEVSETVLRRTQSSCPDCWLWFPYSGSPHNVMALVRSDAKAELFPGEAQEQAS